MINLGEYSIALIATDAGAFNQIIFLLENKKIYKVNPCINGAALDIWNKSNKYSRIKQLDLQEAISKSDLVLTGTSFDNKLEHKARLISKKQKKYCISVVDHWVNYESRFIFNNEKLLPNEIWVFDKYAYDLSKKIFPNTVIQQLKSFYLENIVNQIYNRKKDSENLSILYLLEPIRSEWAQDYHGEFIALDFFITNAYKLNIFKKNSNIVLKPHPSDEKNKYQSWRELQKGWHISIDDTNNLIYLLNNADVVIGCETYALYIASLANKKVVTSLPLGAPKFKLPIPKIIELRNL
tara:strand:+ start:111 stop:995 length:885 start_codon:yes stop_codon:yes gene_type:complete